MKRWCALVFPFLVCTSCLCGYASPQDRQYVDYFLHLQAADLFRTQSFLLNWSCAYINCNRLQGVDFSFNCYRTLSVNEARKLLISVAEDLVNRINKDRSIQERNLLPEPFNLNQLYLKIETENVFSAQADPETIRVMILDRGNITYESYRGSTIFYGRTLEYHETLEMARMLLGEVPAFGEKPMPPQASGYRTMVAPPAPETPPSLPNQAVEQAQPQVKQMAPEQPLQGSKAAQYTKEILPPTTFPQPGPEVPLSESSSLKWKEETPPGPQQIQATGRAVPVSGQKESAASQPAENALEENGPQLTGMAGEEESEQPRSLPNMLVEPSEASQGASGAIPLDTLNQSPQKWKEPLSDGSAEPKETQGGLTEPEASGQPTANLIWRDDEAEAPKEILPESKVVPDAPLSTMEQEPAGIPPNTPIVPENNNNAVDGDHSLTASDDLEAEEDQPHSEEASSFLAWVAKKLDSPSEPEETGNVQVPEQSSAASEEIAENIPDEQDSEEPQNNSEEPSSFLAWVAKKLDSPSEPEETSNVQVPEQPSAVSEENAVSDEQASQGAQSNSEEPSSFLAWVAKKLDSPSEPEETGNVQVPEQSSAASEEIAVSDEQASQGAQSNSEEPSSFLAWVAMKLDSPSEPEETTNVQLPEQSLAVSEENAVSDEQASQETQSSSEEPSSFLVQAAKKLGSPSTPEEPTNTQVPKQSSAASEEIAVPNEQDSQEAQKSSENSSSILDWITRKFGTHTEEATNANEVSKDSEEPSLAEKGQRLPEPLPSVTSQSLQSESQDAVLEQTSTEQPMRAEEEPGDDPSKMIMHPPHEVLEPTPIETPEPKPSFADRWFGWMKSSSTNEIVQTTEEPDASQSILHEASVPTPIESPQLPQEPTEPALIESPQPLQEPTEAMSNETPEPQSSFVDRWFGWMKPSSEGETGQKEEGPSDDTSQIIMHPPHEASVPTPIESPQLPQEPTEPAPIESPQPLQEPTEAMSNETPEPQSSFVDRWFGWMKPSSEGETGQKEEGSSDDTSQIIMHPPHEVVDPTLSETSEPQSSFVDRWFGWIKPSSKEESSEIETVPPVSESADSNGRENATSTEDQQDLSFGDRILGWFRSTPENTDQSKTVADVYEPSPLPPVIDDERAPSSSDENGKDNETSQDTRPWYARLGSIFSLSSDSTMVQNQDDSQDVEESVGESDEEALAWVERFGSWSREKPSENQAQDQQMPHDIASLQPKNVEQTQVETLAKAEQVLPQKNVVHEGSQTLIADRLGDVSRPDEVWKDLDQDDYCPDDNEDLDEEGLDEDVQSRASPRNLLNRQSTGAS